MRSEHKNTRVNELSVVYFKWVSARDAPTDGENSDAKYTHLTFERCIAESTEWRALPRNTEKYCSHLQRNGNALIIIIVFRSQRAVDETPHATCCLSLQFHCILGCNLPNEFSVCWRLSARITRTIIIAWVAFFVYLIYDTITGSLRFVKHFSSFHRERERHGKEEKKKQLCSGFWQRSIFHSTSLLYFICYTLQCRCNQAHSFCSGCDHLLLCLAERFGAKLYRDARTRRDVGHKRCDEAFEKSSAL